MKLSPQHARWFLAWVAVSMLATFVDIFFIPAGHEWRWVNFGVDQVEAGATLAMVALLSPRRRVIVGLMVAWVALALFTFPRSL